MSPLQEGNREIELKFLVTTEEVDRMWNLPAFSKAEEMPKQRLRSIYFDTNDFILNKNSISLRIRETGTEQFTLCCKYPASDGPGTVARNEIEVALSKPEIDLSKFDSLTCQRLERLVRPADLRPAFEINVERHRKTLRYHTSVIETDFDQGKISDGLRSVPLSELEFELISGLESDLHDMARLIAQTVPLRLVFTSKPTRGFWALSGQIPPAAKARRLKIPPVANVADLLRAALTNTLQHVAGNWDAAQTIEVPERLHQLRVGLRRMSSILLIFADLLDDVNLRKLRSEIRKMARATNEARDLDVLHERINAKHQVKGINGQKQSDLLLDLEMKRESAYRKCADAMGGGTANVAILQVLDLSSMNPVTLDLTRGQSRRLHRPARKFARKALDKLYARVLRRASFSRNDFDNSFHDLRVALKDLRYVCEVFADLFEKPSKFRKFMKHTGDFLDLLGRHNDAIRSADLLGKLMGPEKGEASDGEAFSTVKILEVDRSAKRIAKKCLVSFKASEPFWR